MKGRIDKKDIVVFFVKGIQKKDFLLWENVVAGMLLLPKTSCHYGSRQGGVKIGEERPSSSHTLWLPSLLLASIYLT